MEKDGKLVYIPNVMAGVTISGINTAACLLLTAVLFLLEKGKGGRIAGLAVFGGLCLFGWLLFGGLYVFCFRKTAWEFSGDGFRKKRAGKTVFFRRAGRTSSPQNIRNFSGICPFRGDRIPRN